jgi:hypothetical protein
VCGGGEMEMFLSRKEQKRRGSGESRTEKQRVAAKVMRLMTLASNVFFIHGKESALKIK